MEATQLKTAQWAKTTLAFDSQDLPAIDEVQLLLPNDAKLLVDDLLLYEPGTIQ
jgi:hypothetical protein